MSERPPELSGAHPIAELLPFYANGTLEPAERERVETELGRCEQCAAELAEIRALEVALRARAGAAPPLRPGAFDAALARATLPPVRATAVRLTSSWWSAPARWAAAAAIVLGFSATAVAAWHAHAFDGTGTAVRGTAAAGDGMMVYRATSGPAAAPQQKLKINTLKTDAAGGAAPAAAPANAPHRLAKRGRISLLVRDVESALATIRGEVHAAGGDVTSLADATPRDASSLHRASLEVEVPADRLEPVLDRLATVGAVRERGIDAEDVEGSIVDEEARLRNLTREEADLRKLMDRGGKVSEILSVQQTLSDVRGQIEELQAQHQHDLHRVATSTIAVTLTEDRPNAAPAKPGAGARIDGAWRSGAAALRDTLVALVSGIVWCVAVAPLPLGLGTLAFALTRWLRARAKTAAHGTPAG